VSRTDIHFKLKIDSAYLIAGLFVARQKGQK